jgi:hypothetical protein
MGSLFVRIRGKSGREKTRKTEKRLAIFRE